MCYQFLLSVYDSDSLYKLLHITLLLWALFCPAAKQAACIRSSFSTLSLPEAHEMTNNKSEFLNIDIGLGFWTAQGVVGEAERCWVLIYN